LFHFNPDRLEELVSPHVQSAYLSSRYNIAFWFWETTKLPDYWVTVSELFNEIWVGSSFCESVVAAKISKPITRIPLNVSATEPDPSLGRRELGLPEKGFLFLTMMDFFSRPERKNPFGTIEAFEKAFGSGSTEAYLIVKVTNSGISRELQRLKDLSRNNSRIIILDRFLARSELQSLISNIDCLVSLHRAEGFGLPIAEAMSFGKPVIATDWSANMDFMTNENSFPVSYDIVKLNSCAPPYPKGTIWANPRIDEAAEVMKKLVNSPELCKQVGDKARADIQAKFNAVVTGEKIVERLKQIQRKM
jgi:glycosyltransferase involved in cell wall biosynthesis